MPQPQIELLPLAALTPYARNARTHSAEQLAQLVASLREFGFTNPVLIDADGGILAGHGRAIAAQQLGLAEVPCLRWANVSKSMKRNGVKDVICQDCGTEFTVRKDTKPSVCKKCASMRGAMALSLKPKEKRWRSERKPCALCGKPIRASTGQTYCSLACRMVHKRTDRKCKTCGKIFQVRKSALQESTNASGNFCCRQCYEKWLCHTERTTGRGSQWKKTRDSAIKRQPFCALCGTFNNIQVHHIVPFRLTKDNSKNNLVSLCVKHHKIVETITHDIEHIEKDLDRMQLIIRTILNEKIQATWQKLKTIRNLLA